MDHCSPFVIPADVFQGYYSSERASALLVRCMQTAELVAPEKHIMKTSPKRGAGNFIHRVEEEKWAALPAEASGLFASGRSSHSTIAFAWLALGLV